MAPSESSDAQSTASRYSVVPPPLPQTPMFSLPIRNDINPFGPLKFVRLVLGEISPTEIKPNEWYPFISDFQHAPKPIIIKGYELLSRVRDLAALGVPELANWLIPTTFKACVDNVRSRNPNVDLWAITYPGPWKNILEMAIYGHLEGVGPVDLEAILELIDENLYTDGRRPRSEQWRPTFLDLTPLLETNADSANTKNNTGEPAVKKGQSQSKLSTQAAIEGVGSQFSDSKGKSPVKQVKPQQAKPQQAKPTSKKPTTFVEAATKVKHTRDGKMQHRLHTFSAFGKNMKPALKAYLADYTTTGLYHTGPDSWIPNSPPTGSIDETTQEWQAKIRGMKDITLGYAGDLYQEEIRLCQLLSFTADEYRQQKRRCFYGLALYAELNRYMRTSPRVAQVPEYRAKKGRNGKPAFVFGRTQMQEGGCKDVCALSLLYVAYRAFGWFGTKAVMVKNDWIDTKDWEDVIPRQLRLDLLGMMQRWEAGVMRGEIKIKRPEAFKPSIVSMEFENGDWK